MSKFNWQKFNLQTIPLARKFFEYNQKNIFHYYEEGYYNHIRDIFCLVLLLNKKNDKINILDFGSNILSLCNIQNKIDLTNYDLTIFDPFFKTDNISSELKKNLKIKIISNIKSIKKNKYDMIHFGSSIQYINDFFILFDSFNFKKTKNILITQTPLSLENSYIAQQWNYKNLYQNKPLLRKK